MIQQSYLRGRRAAFAKFALEAPNVVDQLVAGVEHAKDVAPAPAPAPAPTPALDGTMPLQLPQGA